MEPALPGGMFVPQTPSLLCIFTLMTLAEPDVCKNQGPESAGFSTLTVETPTYLSLAE